MHNYSNTYTVAKNYSKSLFELAVESNSIDEIYSDFTEFYQIFTDSGELASVLNDKFIVCEKRQKLAQVILDKFTSNKVFAKFILLLISSQRINYIGSIYNSFQERVYKYNGLLDVSLVSHSSITTTLEKDLTKILEKKYNKTIKLAKDVDAQILGGFTLKVGSDLIDASLRNNINSLKEISKKNINNYLN
ncbi:MAG: ATP synthase F1 subunit delta [Rickettsiales bacterium]|jgi:F-type H+-transporting ATPase subunit delta|nr:ATP synthase F1 subunit delta [Rickettsiales bacterium]